MLSFAFYYVFSILPKNPAFTQLFLTFFLRIQYTRRKGNAKIKMFNRCKILAKDV